jgi:hypothetical protein
MFVKHSGDRFGGLADSPARFRSRLELRMQLFML